MAFSDFPLVDDAAERSDESNIALQALFSLANGFQCRALPKDTGIDYMVELVTGRQARGWHFGVQLKSVKEITTIDDGSMISYLFKTSRLNYLGVSVPNMSIIVIYDHMTKQCYYEFASVITERLFNERGTAEWEVQDTVYIHIPIDNKLDAGAIPGLHDLLAKTFNNAVRMNDSHGGAYGLPRTSARYSPEDYDLNSAEGIIGYLKKNGTDLFIDYQLGEISRLVAKLTDHDIEQHTSILCLAASTRCLAGRFNASHLLCIKALRKSDLTEDQRVQVLFDDLKNRVALGKIDPGQLISEMDALKQRSLSTQSRLTLAVNRLLAELGNGKYIGGPPDALRKQIFDLFAEIQASDLSGPVKFLLNLWNADTYSLFINLTFTFRARLRNLGGFNQWAKSMEEIIALDKDLLDLLGSIGRKASGKSIKLVRAYTLQIHVKHLVTREIDFSALQPERNNFEGFQHKLQENINLALTAVNYFNEEGVRYEAYITLRNALELLEIGKFKLAKILNDDIDGLYELLRAWEDEMLLDPADLQVPGVFVRAGLEPAREGEVVADFTAEQNKILSTLLSRRPGLSADQLVNLTREINSYLEVFRRCPPDEIGIRSIYQPFESAPGYDHPVRYALIKKSFNFESAPNYNIEVLLKDWGY